MNKKALMVMRYFTDDSGKNLANKFQSQIDAMTELGYDCTYFTLENGTVYTNKNGERNKAARIPFHSTPVLHNIFEYKALFGAAALEAREGYDVSYTRAAPQAGCFKSLMKALHEGCGKNVVEIPTYPPEKEARNDKRLWIKLISGNSSRIARASAKYVDLYTLIGERADSYLERPAVNIINGTDPGRFRKHIPRKSDGSIHILAVASIVEYHGFDRVIRGMDVYRKKGGRTKIYFHIVGPDGGDGTLDSLKKLTAELGLNDNVTFEGPRYGEELDSLFDRCDIACHSLAGFRIGIRISFNLKAAEYLSRGIPFISCSLGDEEYDGVPGNYHEIPEDDTPVDIEAVIRFAEGNVSNGAVCEEMREYAKRFTWRSQFEKMLEALGV